MFCASELCHGVFELLIFKKKKEEEEAEKMNRQ